MFMNTGATRCPSRPAGRRTSARRQRGNELIEFVLLLPLTIFLVFALIEFSIAMFDYGVLLQASRDGAREAALYWVDVTQITPDSDPADDQRIPKAEVDSRIGDWTDFLINFGDTGASWTCTTEGVALTGTNTASAGHEVACPISFDYATVAGGLLNLDSIDMSALGVHYVE